MNQGVINGAAPPPHLYRQQVSTESTHSQQQPPGVVPSPHPAGLEHQPRQNQPGPPQQPQQIQPFMTETGRTIIQLPSTAQVQRTYLPGSMPQREFVTTGGGFVPTVPPQGQQFASAYMYPGPMMQNPGNYPGSQFFNAGMIVGAQEQGVGRIPPAHPSYQQPPQPNQQPPNAPVFQGYPPHSHSQAMPPQAGVPSMGVPPMQQFAMSQPPQPTSAPPPQPRKKNLLIIQDPESKEIINMEEMEAAKGKDGESPAPSLQAESATGATSATGGEAKTSPSVEDKKTAEVRDRFAREIANKYYGEEGLKTERKDEVQAGSAPPPSSGILAASLAAAESESESSAVGDRTRLASSVPPPERPVTPTAPPEEQTLPTALKEKLTMQPPAAQPFVMQQPPTMHAGYPTSQPTNGNVPAPGTFQPPFQPMSTLQRHFPPGMDSTTAFGIGMAPADEVNGRPEPTDELENGLEANLSKEEKIKQLDEEFSTFMQDADEKSNIEAKIYSAEFLMLMRRIVKELQHVKCTVNESDLAEVGIDLAGMPASAIVNTSRPPRRYGMEPNKDPFVPPWGLSSQSQPLRMPGSRPSNYMGRNSEKMRIKKPPTGRQSMPAMSKEVMPKKSENAWKPKREEKLADRTADDARYEDIKKELRGLLNKITPSTYEDLSSKFCDYKVHQDPKLLIRVIDLIFDKAVEEPSFCPLYSDLCKKQVEIEIQQVNANIAPGEKRSNGSFRLAIIERCQKTFEGDKSDEIKEIEKDIEKANEENDEAKKTQLEDRLNLLKAKEKRRFLGIILFISQLYRHDLLIDKIIEWCVVELVKRYGEHNVNDEIYIEYAVKMLQDVGQIYVKRKQGVRAPSEAHSPAEGSERKKSQTVARKSQQKTSSAATPTPAPASEQPQDPIEKVLQHLSSVKQKLSNRARFMIMDLEDLRKNNWNPRREKQGPKTMEEVKNDLLEEAAENQAERDAYDRRAAAARSDYMGRKSSRQNVSGYQGRGSSDNRAQQQSLPYDKRAAAAQASTQATSLSSMAKKEMSSLRMADQTTKLGGSKGSYFARKSEQSLVTGMSMYSERAAPSPPLGSLAPTPPPTHQSSSPSLMATVEEGISSGERLSSGPASRRETDSRSPPPSATGEGEGETKGEK